MRRRNLKCEAQKNREENREALEASKGDLDLRTRVWCARLKSWFQYTPIPDQVLSFRDCIFSSLIVKYYVPVVFPEIRVLHVNRVLFISFLFVVKFVCNFRLSESILDTMMIQTPRHMSMHSWRHGRQTTLRRDFQRRRPKNKKLRNLGCPLKAMRRGGKFPI